MLDTRQPARALLSKESKTEGRAAWDEGSFRQEMLVHDGPSRAVVSALMERSIDIAHEFTE